MTSTPALDTSPLGVLLVKSGSNGETLLFRYPYSIDNKKDNDQRQRTSRYAIVLNNHHQDADNDDHNPNEDPFKSQAMPPYTVLTSSVADSRTSQDSKDSLALVLGFTDEAFANLFAVSPKLCGQKFELKVNDLRFVGHPMLLASPDVEKDLLTFNVVFALKANANHNIVDCYHDLSKRIAIGLSFEEKRCGYLSAETKLMIASHDEVIALAEEGHCEESPYKLILEKSRLAKDLKRVFEDLSAKGMVHLRLNRWIEISFCLPQKVHSLALKSHHSMPTINSDHIHKCLEALRPYHGMLLLTSAQELMDSLPQDASPSFFRVIRMANPMKNLMELAADADLTLAQVFHVVAQLVYWAKATVIFPLCESNVYTIHPLAPTSFNSPILDQFTERFPGNESLLYFLSEFSLGISLSQWRNPLQTSQQQLEQVQMIIWMLQRRLLLQLHTYVFLVPMSKASSLITKRLSQHTDRPHSSLTADTDTVELSIGSSFPSEDSLATSPLNAGTAFSNKTPSDDGFAFDEATRTSVLAEVGLQQHEIDSILKVSASKCLEDLKLFAKLCPYFNGRHHLEDIMYYENIRRGVLLSLLDKFRDVLFTCQYEDAAVSKLCPYDSRI